MAKILCDKKELKSDKITFRKTQPFNFDDLSEQVSLNQLSDSKTSQNLDENSENDFEPTCFFKASRTLNPSDCEHTVVKN